MPAERMFISKQKPKGKECPGRKQHALVSGRFTARGRHNGAVVEKGNRLQERCIVFQRKSQHAGKQCQQQVLKEYLMPSSLPVALERLQARLFRAIRLAYTGERHATRLIAGISNRMAITAYSVDNGFSIGTAHLVVKIGKLFIGCPR